MGGSDLNPQNIIVEARALGLELTVQAGNLVVRGAGVRPTQLIRAIRQHKAEVLGLLLRTKARLSEVSEVSERSREETADCLPSNLPLPDTLQAPGSERRAQ